MERPFHLRSSWLLVFSVLLVAPSNIAAQVVEWVEEFGTSTFDDVSSIAISAQGEIYLGGATLGNLHGYSGGKSDGILRKYDARGQVVWGRQIHHPSYQSIRALAIDDSGLIHVAETTHFGTFSSASSDYQVTKYTFSVDGWQIFSRSVGSLRDEWAHGISLDTHGNTYVLGETWGSFGRTNVVRYETFVTKFALNNAVEWTMQYGRAGGEIPEAITTNDHDITFVLSNLAGRISPPLRTLLDYSLTQLSTSGSIAWTERFGTIQSDKGLDVASDGQGNIYVAGQTGGDFGGTNAGLLDAFVAKHDVSGAIQWVRQFGGPLDDAATSVTTDSFGNVFVVGGMQRSLSGQNVTVNDIFVHKIDPNGELQWAKRFPMSGYGESYSISTDNLGNVYVTGSIWKSNEHDLFSDVDAFLMKIKDVPFVPEPASYQSLAFLAVAAAFITRTRRT